MTEYKPKKDTFIAGTLDQYAEITALANIASARRTMSSREQGVSTSRTEHTIAKHIHTELAQGGNPIASVLDTSLNYTRNMQDNDGDFNLRRATSIMQADENYRSIINHLNERSFIATDDLVMNTVLDKVNQQTQLYCAQVTMATCHDVMNGKPLTNELVEQHTKEKVLDVLDQKSQLQKELSVEILSLNEMKEEVLSDMSFADFQQQFHKELKGISALDSFKINELHSKVMESGVEAPAQFESLRVASANIAEKNDFSWRLELPVTNSEVYGVLQRENIPFNSQAYLDEQVTMNVKLNTNFDQYLTQVAQKQGQEVEQKPAQNLTELLKTLNPDSGPSM